MLVNAQSYMRALFKIYISDSGDNIQMIVASDNDATISSVRQAFRTVFGKATVTGVAVESSNVAAQPVGFAAGVKAAETKIHSARNIPSIPKDLPIVAVENFLLEAVEDKWFVLDVILLDDPKNHVNIRTFTQMTPVPTEMVTMARKATPVDYPSESGLAVTIDNLMANDLEVSPDDWHYIVTGVDKRDIILLAAQSLARTYKNAINPVGDIYFYI